MRQYKLEESLKKLAKNVKLARAKKGLSLRDLSKISGVSLGTITRLEHGKDTSIGVLSRLAHALEVSVVDLLGDDIAVGSREITFYEALGVVTESLARLRRGDMPPGLVDEAALRAYMARIKEKKGR